MAKTEKKAKETTPMPDAFGGRGEHRKAIQRLRCHPVDRNTSSTAGFPLELPVSAFSN